MASFGPRRLLKVRQGGLLYKFWRPAIPRGVRPLKSVETLRTMTTYTEENLHYHHMAPSVPPREISQQPMMDTILKLLSFSS